jgi:hypothetical protein
MALRAERESKSFADLAPEYARFGVRVAATPEPLTEADLGEKFPEGLGKDTELVSLIRAKFPLPAAGAAFVPKVYPDPIPTTRVNERLNDRGSFIVRWNAVEPPKQKDVADVRADMDQAVYARRREDMARDALADLRKKVEADPGDRAAALRARAAEAGLEVQTLRRFNQYSWSPAPPEDGTTPEQKAAADRVRRRVRVQHDWHTLSRTDPGKFRDPILLDQNVGAAFLELVTEKTDPVVQEFGDDALARARSTKSMELGNKLGTMLSFDELAKRYELRFEPDYKKEFDDARKRRKQGAGGDAEDAPDEQ